MLLNFVLSVFIGAFIGYITNYLAIKMLFRPYNKIYLFNRIPLPFTPGVIPKEREKIIKAIADTLDRYILPEEKIKEILEKSNYKEKLHKRIEAVIEEVIDNIIEDLKKNIKESINLGKINIKAVFIIGIIDKALSKGIDKFKIKLKEKLLENASEVIEKNIDEEIKNLVYQLDIKKAIEESLYSIDIETLEYIILGISDKQLKHLTYLGAILGAFIGAIQFFISTFLK